MSDAEASFLDLHLSISDGFVKTKNYDKRDDFDFDISSVHLRLSKSICSNWLYGFG